MSRPVETRLVAGADPIQLRETAGDLTSEARHARVRRMHRMSLGERAVATIALFLGLLGLSVLVTTFGPAGTFWCALVVGWMLRDVDAWLRANGG